MSHIDTAIDKLESALSSIDDAKSSAEGASGEAAEAHERASYAESSADEAASYSDDAAEYAQETLALLRRMNEENTITDTDAMQNTLNHLNEKVTVIAALVNDALTALNGVLLDLNNKHLPLDPNHVTVNHQFNDPDTQGEITSEPANQG